MNWYKISSFSERGLDSSNAKLTRDFIIKGWVFQGDSYNLEVYPLRLDQVLDWPELYTKYPTLKNVKVFLKRHHRDPKARAVSIGGPENSRTGFAIYLNRDLVFEDTPNRLAQTIIHEVTHMIRLVEGKEFGTLSTHPNRKNNEGEIEADENGRAYRGPWSDDFDVTKD